MVAYTIRRILWFFPVLWAVATITFFLMHAVPGGPFTQDKARPPAVQQALDEKYNLNDPLWRQYSAFMLNAMKGDLGISTRTNDKPVTEVIRRTFFVTAQLGVLAFIVASVVGLTLGTLSALNHNGPVDYLGVGFATVGAAVPNFILGSFLVIFFAIQLPWFKISGWGGPLEWSQVFDPAAYDWRKVVLPVVTLSVLPAAFLARVTRASVLEVLSQDYVRTARSKGLASRSVVLGHVMKNSMIPVLTLMGPTFAALVSGSFIVETMFSIGGLGSESIKSITQRDYGMIMGTTLFFAALVVTVNLIVDLLYAVVDPRIRYS